MHAHSRAVGNLGVDADVSGEVLVQVLLWS